MTVCGFLYPFRSVTPVYGKIIPIGYIFGYDEAYLRTPHAALVSLTLPLRMEPYGYQIYRINNKCHKAEAPVYCGANE